jgi:hypothetical protein
MALFIWLIIRLIRLVFSAGTVFFSQKKLANSGPVHSAYNPSFSACFFSRNSIFLSQQISQQCFSAGLSAQLNGSSVFQSAYNSSRTAQYSIAK